MKITRALLFLPTLVLPLVSAVTVPGADTPLFYLIASGPESSGVNFLPLRVRGDAPNYYSLLTSTSAPIAKFHIQNGMLMAPDLEGTNSGAAPWRPIVETFQTASYGCSTHGVLTLLAGGSSNKCATYGHFGIESNQENSQLGARMRLNSRGRFYVCGENKMVYYKVDAADGPDDCTYIDLYTLPVVE